MSLIMCTVKDAYKLMEHMDENDMVILTVLDKKKHLHSVPKKIKKKNGEELIKKADIISYQDNVFFGTIRNCKKRKRYHS